MSEPLPIRDPENVRVTFVNEVANIGHLNGVINVTLLTAQWTPDGQGNIPPDLVIGARLRFDLACAQQIHSMLGDIIKQNTKPAPAGKPN